MCVFFSYYSMAEDSDGNDNLTAVVICEGDYHDPTFPQKLNKLVARLNSLIDEQPKSKRLKVNKVRVELCLKKNKLYDKIIISFYSMQY
jgi:hypothetical protein